jgi:DNA-binding transcriptional ArsR family regulator
MVDGARTLSVSGSDSSPGLESQASIEPEDVRFIRDVDTLRAISDATRVRILEQMVQRLNPAWSVKELAAALGMPQTRLYHHVEMLLERDLIRAVERRVVSGIIETRYAVAAKSFQLDRALFTGDTEESLAVLHDTLIAVFDTARAEVELAVRLGVIDSGPEAPAERRLLLTRGLARLSPARAGELRDRLQALAEEFGGDTDDPPAPDGQAYGIVLAVYPMPPTQEPLDD